MVTRGEVWWASLPNPQGSGPGSRRPVLVLQSNKFNESKISTVIIAVITSNLELAKAPGNVLLRSKESKLSKDSVINISQIITVDKTCLTEHVSKLDNRILAEVESGLRLVLQL
ncbi:MAG: type II toxin-antitoxin system PemK/MazF family toxin [Myxococcaceae bacterium]